MAWESMLLVASVRQLVMPLEMPVFQFPSTAPAQKAVGATTVARSAVWLTVSCGPARVRL